MYRCFDIGIASVGLLCFFPLFIIVLIAGVFDTGSPLFFQKRVGKNQKAFTLMKFRTMKKNTASVASHLASSSSITPLGRFLRRTKIDELPQLINVIKGDMSLVGPRPNLFNQHELIHEREIRGVYDVLPGITGLAQVQRIDMSTPKLLAEVDSDMINTLNLSLYLKYLFLTVAGRGLGDVVS